MLGNLYCVIVQVRVVLKRTVVGDLRINVFVQQQSSFQNCHHPDDHTIQTTDTPGFKPFAMLGDFSTTKLLQVRRNLLQPTHLSPKN